MQKRWEIDSAGHQDVTKIRLNIFAKGLLLISLPLVFTVMLVALLFRAQSESADAAWWQTHTKDVLHLAEEAYTHAIESHSATRAYILIGKDSNFNEVAEASMKEATAALDKLATDTKDNTEQNGRIQTAIDRLRDFDHWLAGERARVGQGDQAGAIEQVRSRKGVVHSEAFNEAIDSFKKEEERLDTIRTAAVQRARQVQRVTLISGALAMFVVSGAALLVFGKSVAARVGVLTQNAGRMADGRELLPAITGTDEIAQLDEAMHAASAKLATAAESELLFKRELERRADELVRANESLRQQTQENEMFVYSVSHDLRSPLVNLQGFSKELEFAGQELGETLADERIPADVRKRAQQVIDSDIKDSVRFIQTAVTRSASIIDSLLRLSRAGRVVYRPENVDVNGTVKRVIDAMRGTIEMKGATVKAQVLLPVWGDATAVEQIFGNLIGNAVNYLDASRPGFIEVGMLNGGTPDRARMRTYYVRDNGLGIPEAHINKVFVAFQRLHGDVAKGEGIGLALVRRIIERHGGRASVESTVGVGTTFFVSLPAEARSEGEAELKGSSESSIASSSVVADEARGTALKDGNGARGGAGATKEPAGAVI